MAGQAITAARAAADQQMQLRAESLARLVEVARVNLSQGMGDTDVWALMGIDLYATATAQHLIEVTALAVIQIAKGER